jgi:V-type H+-transporting ATPase subunit e
MAQMNPLIGPKLHQNTILIMGREWDGKAFEN